MSDITIPPEAVRAAKIAWANNGGPTSDDDMAAALRAGIAAWPHMSAISARKATPTSLGYGPYLILPLPTEDTSAES